MKATQKVDALPNHSSKSAMFKNNIVNLRNAMLNQGLTIVAQKDFGKTNTLQVLISSMNDFIPIVVDYATQHAFKLGSQFQVKFMNESYWRKPTIHIDKPIILDFSQTTKKLAGEILRDIIVKEYQIRVKAVIEGFREGKTREEVLKHFKWLIFCIEESQDLIGRYLRQDDDLATAMNCGRNYRISFIFMSQRLADLNTRLTERTCYLLGKLIGDNNLRKISKVLGLGRKKLRFIESLPKGEFVFYNGERIEKLRFPKFEGYGRAYEIKRSIVQRKPRSLWQRMKEAFSSKTGKEDSEICDYEEEYQQEEEEWDEFLTTEEEWEW